MINREMNKKRHIFVNFCFLLASVGFTGYLIIILLSVIGLLGVYPLVVPFVAIIATIALGLAMYNNCCRKFKKEKETTDIY